MNPSLSKLKPYPFERLAQLKAQSPYQGDLAHIALSIGEPKHDAPSITIEAIQSNFAALTQYPATRGLPELREAISRWIGHRFNASINPDSQVLPCNGTREALFCIVQALATPGCKVGMPNPFYQIYEGAALLAGAEPVFINPAQCEHAIPDYDTISESTWRDIEVLYVCTPDNPSGICHTLKDFQRLFELADTYDFNIISDECYSELYREDSVKPLGILDACNQLGRSDYRRCLAVHSLSKRSNLPGLRSGFIAGDAELIQPVFQYRTYHGCAMGIPSQHGSIAAWEDEQHVQQNRALYNEKYEWVLTHLNPTFKAKKPPAGFYLWIQIGCDDIDYAQDLFHKQNLTVLPGQFLARSVDGVNPGRGYIRLALVADFDECKEAVRRLNEHWEGYHAKS